jgi:addiction module RelE/StbE family toxin
MPRSVEYSTRAKNHLKNIAEFIAQENPSASLKVSEYLTSSVDELIDFPHTGKPWQRESRKLVLSKYPYSIIYRVTPAKVIILAVAHQSFKNQK